jgi:hypothetical protein
VWSDYYGAVVSAKDFVQVDMTSIVQVDTTFVQVDTLYFRLYFQNFYLFLAYIFEKKK